MNENDRLLAVKNVLALLAKYDQLPEGPTADRAMAKAKALFNRAGHWKPEAAPLLVWTNAARLHNDIEFFQ